MEYRWPVVAGILMLVGVPALPSSVEAAPQTLFATDFQNDSLAGWIPGGKGGIELTNYQGNWSMHMTDRAEAVATVQTKEISTVSIRASFAAFQLTPHDKCIGEYSTDNGASWHDFVTVRASQADGLTLHAGEANEIDVSGTSVLLVRLRASLSVHEASCWGDAITVTGEHMTVPTGGAAGRSQLLFNEFRDNTRPGPVSMQAFARPAGAMPPKQNFEGRLTLDSPSFEGGFQVVRNTPYNVVVDAVTTSLPEFDFEFVQDADALIPVKRGPIAGTHRNWEIILEPGQAWNEPEDAGFTRASFPFSLRERNANCLHNGVMSFLFKNHGTISRVYYQISSETCAYFKFNGWGSAVAHYKQTAVVNSTEIKAAWRAEVAARLPVRPLSELIAAHPSLSESGFTLAPPADVDLPTLFGVVFDGVNYVGGCETRNGPYPYCDVLDLPSYSTAKSIVGAVGLMRLGKLWPGARQALISGYVPQCATRDWAGVTFEDALNLVTGVYDDAGFEADEMSDNSRPFFLALSHADKIAFACTHYHRKSPPGKVWVYRTSDYYVLGTAMQEFVRRHMGSGSDLYRDVHVAQLWRRLHLSPVLDSTLRTYDDVQQPFTGYGLTYHRDDIARIASFLSLSSGKIDGESLLDDGILARGLQRDPAHRGMYAGFAHFSYVDGMWARDLAPVLGCAKEAWAPFMSGYGGNSVVMLPNGIVYYYFGDSQVWDWSPAAIEINKLRPICS